MRILYGKYFEGRYLSVAEQIPAQTSVVDVCAGNVYLFQKYLKQKSVNYLALDNSPEFVHWAHTQQVNAKLFDIRTENVPQGDYVVMMASLYQFLPEAKDIVSRLIGAAKKKVILSEPVSNLSASHFGPIARLAHVLSIPYYASQQYTGERFTEASILNLFEQFPEFETTYRIPGGREIVGIFKGNLSKKTFNQT